MGLDKSAYTRIVDNIGSIVPRPFIAPDPANVPDADVWPGPALRGSISGLLVNHQLGGFRGEGCLRSPHYSVIEDLVLWAS
jgi:hypothetical protein